MLEFRANQPDAAAACATAAEEKSVTSEGDSGAVDIASLTPPTATPAISFPWAIRVLYTSAAFD